MSGLWSSFLGRERARRTSPLDLPGAAAEVRVMDRAHGRRIGGGKTGVDFWRVLCLEMASSLVRSKNRLGGY